MALQCCRCDPGGTTLPLPRTNHASCWFDNRFFMYGGNGESKYSGCLDDVWILDTAGMTWSEVKCQGSLPGPRCHHTMEAMGGRVWVFGGWTGKRRCNFLHCLDVEKKVWIDMTPKMSHVDPHSSHASAVLDNDTMLVVGRGETGTHAKYGCNIDFLDTRTMKWSTYAGSTISRAGHTVTFMPAFSSRYAIAFGGRQRHQVEQIVCKVKTPIAPTFQTGFPSSMLQNSKKSDVPSGRSYHTATDVNGVMLIYGGFIQGKSVRGLIDGVGDVYLFDANDSKWLVPSVKGDWPKRAGHTAARIAESKVVLFGGEHSRKQHNDCHIISW